jgi:hypothetical protein
MVTNTTMECSYLPEVTDYYTKHADEVGLNKIKS